MKHTPHNIEELLQSGKDVSLTAAEQREMKASLLSYAAFHGMKEPESKTTFSFALWTRSAVAFAFVFMVGASTSYASLESVPGDLLYGVKTHVVEEAVGAFQFSEERELRYQTELLEERLGELQELSRENALTPELLGVLNENMEAHFNDIAGLLGEADSNGLSADAVLHATGDAAAITKAASRMAVTTLGDEAAEAIEQLSDRTTQLQNNELSDFIEESDEETTDEYFGAQLAEIQAELNEADLTATTTETVAQYLRDSDEALSEGDIADAIQHVNDAVQAILTDEYQTDYTDEVME